MKQISLIFAAPVFAFFSCTKATAPPNVHLICIDDLNDWTGFTGGHPQTQTPNMDQLAAKGMVFKNAFCATAECNPSRAALLTGYHSKTTGFTNNFLPMDVRDWIGSDETGDPIPGYSAENIPDMQAVITLPQWFREHGYHTMGCGKVFHHHRGEKHVDTEKSRSEWGVPEGNDLTGNDNRNGIYDGKIVWVDWGPEEVETKQTADHRRATWMADKISSYNQDQPFFAAVGCKKPHDPFYAPPNFLTGCPPGGYLQEGFEKQGNSLLPILEDPEVGWDTPSLTVNLKRYHPMTNKRKGEVYTDEFMSQSLRTDRWKLIEYSSLEDSDDRQYKLYDLKADPEEWNNLDPDADYAHIKKGLIALLRQYPGGSSGPQMSNHPPVVLINNPRPSLKAGPDEMITVEAGSMT